ncbi:MAG: zf-TFIIB domain-containing protein [Pseudomonadota bacterium]
MRCPIDGTDLVITDRSGVEIDYCPSCRGVWLDRGELDKIIDRAAAFSPPPPPPQHSARTQDQRYERSAGRKKKGGMADLLGDIFDF